MYSIKGEGNAPLLWLRGDVHNVSVLGFGGDPTAFAYNSTQVSRLGLGQDLAALLLLQGLPLALPL